MSKKKNYTVRICEDHVIRDPDKVKAILDRIAQGITNTYRKQIKKSS